MKVNAVIFFLKNTSRNADRQISKIDWFNRYSICFFMVKLDVLFIYSLILCRLPLGNRQKDNEVSRLRNNANQGLALPSDETALACKNSSYIKSRQNQ